MRRGVLKILHRSSFSPRVDALAVRSLRFITTKKAVESFYAEFGEHFRPFTLSGSGDFHHLTAVFTRQIKEPFAISLLIITLTGTFALLIGPVARG